MNKELALRTFAYLIGHYKTHNETTINKQEIEAIEFILNDNEFLEQQCKKQKEVIDKINIFLNNHDKNAGKLYYKYNNKYLLSEIKEDIRNILKEVE